MMQIMRIAAMWSQIGNFAPRALMKGSRALDPLDAAEHAAIDQFATETFMIQEEKFAHSNKDHEYCDGESVENLDLSSLRRDDDSSRLLEGTVISFTAEVKDVTHHPFKFEYTQENGKLASIENSTLEPAGGWMVGTNYVNFWSRMRHARRMSLT